MATQIERQIIEDIRHETGNLRVVSAELRITADSLSERIEKLEERERPCDDLAEHMQVHEKTKERIWSVALKLIVAGVVSAGGIATTLWLKFDSMLETIARHVDNLPKGQ